MSDSFFSQPAPQAITLPSSNFLRNKVLDTFGLDDDARVQVCPDSGNIYLHDPSVRDVRIIGILTLSLTGGVVIRNFAQRG